jgi:hypothetical protein
MASARSGNPHAEMRPLAWPRWFHVLFTIKEENFHAGFLHDLRVSSSLTGAILLHLKWSRDEMTSTQRLPNISITAAFPRLRQPKPEVADRGKLRLGSGNITAAFPALR